MYISPSLTLEGIAFIDRNHSPVQGQIVFIELHGHPLCGDDQGAEFIGRPSVVGGMGEYLRISERHLGLDITLDAFDLWQPF